MEQKCYKNRKEHLTSGPNPTREKRARLSRAVIPLKIIDMANKAKLTEHVGAKKHKGAYAGRKRDAKRESNKLRRQQSVSVIKGEIER